MTRTIRHTMTTVLVLAGTTMIALPAPSPASALEAPVKEIPSIHFGWNVDKTKQSKGAPQPERNVCTVESADECQYASANSGPGGFEYAEAIAVNNDLASPHHGDLYIADRGNNRIQEFTATGVFVSMFGWDVNRTKVSKGGATQQEMNVCTATEVAAGTECQAGVEGAGAAIPPGQFGFQKSVAVDQANGDVYVAEIVKGNSSQGERIQKSTAEGAFVLEIGKKVNETTGSDLCTAEEVETKAVKCTGAEQHGFVPDTEPFAFTGGAVLATGGSEDLLYVGEEHRVKEFEAGGKYKREIPLTQISNAPGTGVSALTVDPNGNVYLVYGEGEHVIRKFDVSGKEVKEPPWPLTLYPRQTNSETLEVHDFEIKAIAVDSSSRLAVSEREVLVHGKDISQTEYRPFGSLLDVATGAQITEFSNEFRPNARAPESSNSMVFDASLRLYALSRNGPRGEVAAYAPVPVGELLGRPAVCVEGAEHESNVMFDCTLHGALDPWGVSETEAWFEWGTTSALGQMTATQAIKSVKGEGEEESLVPVSAVLKGLAPNEVGDYRLAAHDHYVMAPESLTSAPLTLFGTPVVAPRIVGEPNASFVHSSSVVLFGQLNPENTNTEYFFEYAACGALAGCEAPVLRTPPVNAGTYGKLGSTVEVRGLQPATTYAYRLVAVNEKGQAALNETGGPQLPEGTFTTGPAPAPQAVTGAFSDPGTSSATISGTVTPDGAPAVYVFELGVYNGASTQYGVAFSGPAGASTTPVGETLALSGLQPGTTYAYRIAVKSSYVKNATGELTGQTMLFTTQGLPSVLASPAPLAMLEVPKIAFPKPVTTPKSKSKKKSKRKRANKKTGKKSGAHKRKSHKGKK
jgi:hypothetical protein